MVNEQTARVRRAPRGRWRSRSSSSTASAGSSRRARPPPGARRRRARPPDRRGRARGRAGAARALPRGAAGALRLPGAPGRLHRRRLARAADAARAPARARRERDASGRRHRRARRAGPPGDPADPRPDRRRAVPRRARDGPGGRLARANAGAPDRRGDRRRRSPTAPSTRRWASSSAAARTIELPLRPRMLRVVVENLVANSIRYCGPGSTCSVTDLPGGAGAAARRRRRRQGRRRERPAAPVRALLPRRPGPHVPRHGPRARDREARRHLGRRHGRGPRRPWPGSRDRLPVPFRLKCCALQAG